MQLKTFTYTKADTSVTERVVLELVKPSTFMEGVDISELSIEEQSIFAAKVSSAYEQFRAEMLALQNEFDISNNYRRFDPLKMTEVKTEWI